MNENITYVYHYCADFIINPTLIVKTDGIIESKFEILAPQDYEQTKLNMVAKFKDAQNTQNIPDTQNTQVIITSLTLLSKKESEQNA